MSTAMHEWLRVPAGTKEARCNRCGHPIYWVHTDGRRLAIDCDTVTGSIIPSAEFNEASPLQGKPWDGAGITHSRVCQAAKPLASRGPSR